MYRIQWYFFNTTRICFVDSYVGARARVAVWLQVEIAELNPSWCAPPPFLLSVAQPPLQHSLFPRPHS
jgi:hypothetical protein